MFYHGFSSRVQRFFRTRFWKEELILKSNYKIHFCLFFCILFCFLNFQKCKKGFVWIRPRSESNIAEFYADFSSKDKMQKKWTAKRYFWVPVFASPGRGESRLPGACDTGESQLLGQVKESVFEDEYLLENFVKINIIRCTVRTYL